MKLTYLMVTLLTLIGCTNNAKLYDPAAAGYNPPPSTTLAPVNACQPVVTLDTFCQHADGTNEDGSVTDLASSYQSAPGKCYFVACGDTDYSEADQMRVYEAYVAKYGGEVKKDYDLCKNKKNTYDDECNDKNAYNFGDPGKCYYKGCDQVGDLGNVHYQILTELYGAENVTVDAGACTQLPKPGCMVTTAENYDPEAGHDDCSCRFKTCTDDRYIEFTQYNTAVTAYVGACASENLTAESAVCASSCQTLNKGCTVTQADNAGPYTVEDGTCTFTGCLDDYWTEYDPVLKEVVIDYAATHGLTVDDILTKTCKTPNP